MSAEAAAPPLRGLHVAFTGADGSGKSTQAVRLCRRLGEEGFVANLVEDKSTFGIDLLRSVAARHRQAPRPYFGHRVTEVVKALEMLRDNAERIRPFVERGEIAVVPRSGFCRLAIAAIEDPESVPLVDAIVHLAGRPDLVLFLDTAPEECLARVEARGEQARIEELRAFAQRLREVARSGRVVRVAGGAPIDDVHERVWEAVRPALVRRREGLCLAGPVEGPATWV